MVKKCLVYKETGGFKIRTVLADGYSMKESVLSEIASIMSLDSANTNTPKWFEHRMRALKNVIDAMSEEERKTLEEEAE